MHKIKFKIRLLKMRILKNSICAEKDIYKIKEGNKEDFNESNYFFIFYFIKKRLVISFP